MPGLMGYSHISLSVTSRDASVAFYRDVFDFEPYEVLDHEAWLETISVHPVTGMVLGFQQHRDNDGEPFEHRRTGLDHLAFRVASRDELVAWQARLVERGAVYTPIADREYGSVLCARDPDGIQVELFYRVNHPEPALTTRGDDHG
ncbi:MAG TPA: VOC family protein [Pseudonocardia sp.]|nr:VOC family protein [Pseudonocardia sp.]